MKKLFKIFFLSGALGYILNVNINSQGIVLPDVFPQADCYPIGYYEYYSDSVVKLTNLVEDAKYWIAPLYEYTSGMLATDPFRVLVGLERRNLQMSNDWELDHWDYEESIGLWKWIGEGTTFNVEYEFNIYNANLIIGKYRDDVGIYIKRDGYYSPVQKKSKIEVVELDCYISGPNLICSGFQTFTLNHANPEQPYSTVNWIMFYPGGSKSGTGKVASKDFGSNPLNGNGNISYTIDHTCGINDQYLNKPFWVGKPKPIISGEQYPECGDINWYFLDADSHWGTYYWNVTSGLTIIGSPYGTKAKIRADEEGNAAIYCDVTNGCGTNYGSLSVYVYCWGFKMSPNPSDDYVEISLDENKVDLNNISEYEIRIYNNQQILVSQIKTKEPSVQINTSKLISGTYYVHVIYNGKVYIQQLTVEH